MKLTDNGGRRYVLDGKEVSEAEYQKAKGKKAPAKPSENQE